LLPIILIFLSVLYSPDLLAPVYQKGDIAPRGYPDGILNVADVQLMSQFAMGLQTPTSLEISIGDVAPVGALDGVLNVADLLVLQRQVLGLAAPGGTFNTLDPPILNSIASPTSINPAQVTGTGTPGLDAAIYNSGSRYITVPVALDASFWANVPLSEGTNLLYATQFDAGAESDASNVVSVTLDTTPPWCTQ
jgi:hypothetical protein